MASLMPIAKQQYFDSNGVPLSGGKVYTYAAGTTSPLATYSDKAGTVPNTNPVILDSRGEATIFWGQAGYKVVLKDSTDATIWTQDNLFAVQDSSSMTFAQQLITATAGQTVFNLSISYTNGTNSLAVYMNGLRLASTDYTETSTTSVTLNTGATVGDELLFVAGDYAASTTGADLVTYTPAGTGAVATTVQTKLRESVSVKDFGAKGDGVTDDTAAFTNAIATGKSIYVPTGTYLVSSQIVLGFGQILYGDGIYQSIITCSSAVASVVALTSGYGGVKNLQITGDSTSRTPLIGLLLYGLSSPCVQNVVQDVIISNTQRGLVLDGYNNTSNPCYWNRFNNVTVYKSAIDGILLTKSGAGDSPNANSFFQVHFYSLGTTLSGSGFYVQNGNFNNNFTDCNSDVHTATPTACFRVGAGSIRTNITGLYCESQTTITNVQIDAGSTDTTIINLLALSAGAAIYDVAGTGNFKTFNAGYPNSHYQGSTILPAATLGKLTFAFNTAAPTPASSVNWNQFYNNAVPAGAFYSERGSICWNSNVGVSNGPTGWICTTGGTPGTWVPFGERYLEGSVTFNPGLVATGAQSALGTITVTGAALGDVVTLSNTVDMQGMVLFGYVSAANTVKVGALNLTGAGVTLASGTVYVRVHGR